MMMMKAGESANIQHEVWSDVDALSQKLEAFSPTDDYTEVVSRQRYRGESELVEFIKIAKVTDILLLMEIRCLPRFTTMSRLVDANL